jgi:biopolymer transport protein ExbB/TolQ
MALVDMMIIGLVVLLIFSFFIMFLMNIRIKQLRRELNDLRDRVIVTGEELYRLSQDIEDFKKIQI